VIEPTARLRLENTSECERADAAELIAGQFQRHNAAVDGERARQRCETNVTDGGV
jgi:hypothetical protein